MRFLLLAGLLLLAARPAPALVGDWKSYTRLFDVRDLEVFQGALYVATSGGIRKVPGDGSSESIYRTSEGLKDVSIQGLVSTPEGDLWATSRLGLLYRLTRDGKRWETFGTSYKSAGWDMRPRAILFRAPYLVLGSGKGLSFFNVRKGAAEANITRMGTERDLAVNSVLLAGDTLYAGTSKGIFRAVLPFDRLVDDSRINIFNPEIWTRVPGTADVLQFDPFRPAEPPVTGDTLPPPDVSGTDTLVAPDTASQAAAHGLLYLTARGIASEYAGGSGSEARTSRYGRIRLPGSTHPNPLGTVTVERFAGRWWLGHVWGLGVFDPETDSLTTVPSPFDIPASEITMVAAGGGRAYAYASPFVFALEGERWRHLPDFQQFSDKADAVRNGSHPFNALGNDDLYLGTWGHGFYAFKDGVGRRHRSGGEPGTSCLQPAVSDPAYTVVFSQAPYRGKGIWLATMRAARPYSLAYYDIAGNSMTCFEVDSKYINPKDLNLIGDDLLAVVTEGGIETFRIRERDGLVMVDPANLTPSLRAPEPVQAGQADLQGNFWVTTLSKRIFYVPGLGKGTTENLSYQALEGFPGNECKSIDRDARGHIWVGCVTGGVVEITPGRDSLGHEFRRYGLNDGLLTENISHLSVDSSTGYVWVVTDQGLARFESASRPLARKLSAARAYPNPFLARHTQVIFDDLVAGSELKILTQSGSVVYSRRLTPSDGHQLRWDGRNSTGSRIREGVYFYVISSSKDVKRGKLIVAR